MVVVKPAEHKGIIERAHNLPRTTRNAAMAANIQRYVDGNIVKRHAESSTQTHRVARPLGERTRKPS